MSSWSMASVAGVAALEAAINKVIALDPETGQRLARMDGKVIEIEFLGLNRSLYLMPTAERLHIFGHYEGEPDATLRGAPVSLLRLAITPGPGSGLFTGEVTIEGDVELGQRFQRTLRSFDVDWEEHLSRLFGDLLSHEAGNLVRGLSAWGLYAVGTLGRNVSEFLQEETRSVPSPAEAEGFFAAVDQLRDDVERLNVRIRLLKEESFPPTGMPPGP